MIVEFAGMAGSGKTTVAASVAETVSAKSLKSPSVRILRQLALRPAATASSLRRWMPQRRGWSDKQSFGRIVRRRIGQDLIPAYSTANHIILQEGIVHRVWSEVVQSPILVNEPWANLLDDPFPLIFLNVDAATAQRRINADMNPRGGVNHTLRRWENPNGSDWRRAVHLYDDVLAVASQHRPVIQIDATLGLDQVVAEVTEAVASALSPN